MHVSIDEENLMNGGYYKRYFHKNFVLVATDNYFLLELISVTGYRIILNYAVEI